MDVKPIIDFSYGFLTCGNIVTRNAAFIVQKECGHLLPAVGGIVKANLMTQGVRSDIYWSILYGLRVNSKDNSLIMCSVSDHMKTSYCFGWLDVCLNGKLRLNFLYRDCR